MNIDLAGRVAVVTGTSQGIGRVIAQDLGARGAHVACASRNLTAAKQCAAEIEAGGGSASVFKVDVRDETSVASLAEQLDKDFESIDVLVNNAGITRIEGVEASALDGWEDVISTNLRGTYLCMKYLLPALERSGRGSIVNIGSILGFVCMRNVAAYSAAKAAVQQLTKQAALDFATKNVRVNCIAPGFIQTEMYETAHPETRKARIAGLQALGRVGQPIEIAYPIAFLASDLASFITGSVLLVDGGLTAQFGLGVIEQWELSELAAG
jgi:3-oxoacyl-[acyl-carrier protein] reductase